MMAPGSTSRHPSFLMAASRTRVNDCASCMATRRRFRCRRPKAVVHGRRCACRTASLPWRQALPSAEWRVLVADDEPAARRGVRQLLAAFPSFQIIGECRDGAEVMDALDRLRPDVVFLD